MTIRIQAIASLLVLGSACSSQGGDNAASDSSTTDTTAGDTTQPTSEADESTGAQDGGESTAATTSEETGETTGTGGEQLPDRVADIVRAFDTAMLECPDRVWPGIGKFYATSQILLVSEMSETAYLWNDQAAGEPGSVRVVATADLPVEWMAFFNLGLFEDVLTLGVSLDFTDQINDGTEWIDFASALALHESFHFLTDQSSWPVEPGSRAAPYPEQAEPRYVRAEMSNALAAQLLLDSPADLGGAAYWDARALTDFPEEMADISPYEVTEGSATYAEAWSSALFHAGCEASDAELLGLVRDNLEDLAPLTFYELDLEAYNLGVLAGGLLRTAQQPDWETEVAGGSPPRALLLADTAAVEQPEDPELLAKVIEAVDARNLELGTEIDPMLERMTSPAHYRVALPLAWVAGSFSLSGFYSLIEVDGQPEAWVSYSALHEAVGGAQIQVEEHTVLFATPTPCEVPMGEDGWLVATIPVEMLVDVGGSFTSADPNVSFTDLPASVVADDDGLDWLCPSEFAMAPEPVFPIAVLRDAEGAIVSVDVWRR